MPLLPSLLKDRGFLTACFGKAEHIQPGTACRWDESLGFTQIKGGRDPQRYFELTSRFIGRARSAGRPFFIMANSHDPHRPFHGAGGDFPPSNEATYKPMFEQAGGRWVAPTRVFAPAEAPPPGYLPDLPEIRRQLAQYLSSCRRADDSVGEILRALDESGLREATLVVFLSDNGAAFPFAKGCVYVNSTRTPMIVRWPGRVAPGTVNRDAYVNGIDFLPTIMEILGQAVPPDTDGRSLLPLLEGNPQPGRDQTVTVFYNTYPVEGGHRPEQTVWLQMRALHWQGYTYIYNHWCDGTPKFGVQDEPAIRKALAEGGATGRLRMFTTRVPEELYDDSADPDALDNLAGQPAQAARLKAMRQRLLDWMHSARDTDVLADFQSLLIRP